MTDTTTGCPPRRNGNMPPGQERPVRTPERPETLHGMPTIPKTKPIPLERRNKTHGACMTWRDMLASFVRVSARYNYYGPTLRVSDVGFRAAREAVAQ